MTGSGVKATQRAAGSLTREVIVRLFAHARELAGGESVCVAVGEPATVGELRQSLLVQLPAAADLLRRSMFAIDNEYVGDDALLPEGASEIACIPPVSGG
jgi:molybdopterin converting factor small subunit